MKEKREIISEEHKTGDLQGLDKLLHSLTRKMLGKKAFAEADVICNWKHIAGEELFVVCRPIKIVFKKEKRTEGVLWIEVVSGAFALELQLKTKILIDKVNTFFGYEAINGVKIVQNAERGWQIKQSLHKSEKKLVTKEEENYIENLSGEIKNSELSEALKSLGCAIIANNKK